MTDRAPSARSAGWAVARLVVVAGAAVAAFLVAGLGDLLVFIAALVAIVVVHEGGHFVTAKWSHMKVTEFFIGFGPRLWSIRRGETEYGIKPIPAGAYVKIPGMSNLEEIDPVDEARTYRQQPFHRRVIVASAGSAMHFVMAFVLAWVAVVSFGVPSATAAEVAGFVKWPGHAQTAAQAAGLRAGDRIVSVAGTRVTDPTTLSSIIQGSGGRPIRMVVERDGHSRSLTVTPQAGHRVNDGEALGPATGSGATLWLIGVSTQSVQEMTGEGPVRAVGTAVIDVGRVTSATVAGLGHVFSPHGLGSFYDQVTNSQTARKAAASPTSSDRIMSLVGAARVATQAEQEGVLYFIEILIALNIVFGLLNMLPMLPLDGGHVAIALYERIRTRRGQPYYRADVNKLQPFAFAFIAVMLLVVVSAVFLDIAHPVANPFR